MQGMVVVGLVVAEISNINVNCVKVIGAQNIDQGHPIILLHCKVEEKH